MQSPGDPRSLLSLDLSLADVSVSRPGSYGMFVHKGHAVGAIVSGCGTRVLKLKFTLWQKTGKKCN